MSLNKPVLFLEPDRAAEVFSSIEREKFEEAFCLELGQASSTCREGFELSKNESQWGVRSLAHPEWKALRLEYTQGRAADRLRQAWNSKELLKDALGFRKGEKLRVIDATAGLLGDSLLMAAWGLEVVAFERNPVLCFLGLKALEALREAGQNLDVCLHCERFSSDASLSIVRERWSGKLDRVYLDPLYPPRPKDALNSKELRLVAGLASGQPQDELQDLIDSALALGPTRVVVKRPQWAEILRHPSRQTTSCEGRSTRFDILHGAEKQRVN